MKKKLSALRDVFVKLSRIYKGDFYIYNAQLTIQGDESFTKLPGVIIIEFQEHIVNIFKDFLNITEGTMLHIKSTDDMKSAIDEILLDFKDVLKTKTYDESEMIITISERLSKVYPKMDDMNLITSTTNMIETHYNQFSSKDYYTLDTSAPDYNKVVEDLFTNKIYIELTDLNPDTNCPNVIVTASLFPMLTDKNIELFEYSCDKVFDDGRDILFNITSRMMLDNFTIYVSYDYTDMSYEI